MKKRTNKNRKSPAEWAEVRINQLRAAYEEQAARIKELETQISEEGDDVGRAEMDASAMVSALKYIVNLSNGWSIDGSTGPGMIAGVRMSWETLARLAMDCARSAVSMEEREYTCASTGEKIRQHFDESKESKFREWSSSGVSQRKAAGKADWKPGGQAEPPPPDAGG